MAGENARRIILDETDSTNSYAKRLIAGGFKGEAVITAKRQTSGRGRQGKSFYSPDGTGLYMSVILRPDASGGQFTLLTAATAVAVCEAIEGHTALTPEIKWVNDIYIGGRKVCGILCESVFSEGRLDAVVAGIGINLTTTDFPPELDTVAGSLGFDKDSEALTQAIADRLFELCGKLSELSFMQYYRSHSCVIGKDITFTDAGVTYQARALSIDDGGGLRVSLPNGQQKLLSGGEISLRLK